LAVVLGVFVLLGVLYMFFGAPMFEKGKDAPIESMQNK
jgi:hypothetical protein